MATLPLNVHHRPTLEVDAEIRPFDEQQSQHADHQHGGESQRIPAIAQERDMGSGFDYFHGILSEQHGP